MALWKTLSAGALIWLSLVQTSYAEIAVTRVNRMMASYYWQPQSLASGGRFNPHGFTAAHRSLLFGTRLRVCLTGCTIVIVNDRGPFIPGRSLDLSLAAAKAIGLTSRGVALVQVEIIK